MRVVKKIFKVLGVVVLVGIVALALTLSHSSDCEPIPPVSAGSQPMKGIAYNCYGGPEVLQYVDLAKPELAEDEILVKVKAAGVNPLDWHHMRGSPYLMRLGTGLGAPDDTRMGVDFAGTVTAVGSAVSKFKIGDDVFGGAGGAFAEYVKIRESRGVAIKPANITFEQAASVPIAAITALQGLRDEGQLQAGQRVLINGASGGVGTFAVQIAKSMGAEVSGVCSTRNVQMVTSLGADHVFDYKKEDFVESGEKFDLILDNVGNRSISELRSVLKPHGTLVIIGGPSGNWFGPLKNILMAVITSPFVDQKMQMFIAQFNPLDMATLGELMQAGKMTPVIDRRFSLSEAPDAILYSESGRARGKIVINM